MTERQRLAGLFLALDAMAIQALAALDAERFGPRRPVEMVRLNEKYLEANVGAREAWRAYHASPRWIGE